MIKQPTFLHCSVYCFTYSFHSSEEVAEPSPSLLPTELEDLQAKLSRMNLEEDEQDDDKPW